MDPRDWWSHALLLVLLLRGPALLAAPTADRWGAGLRTGAGSHTMCARRAMQAARWMWFRLAWCWATRPCTCCQLMQAWMLQVSCLAAASLRSRASTSAGVVRPGPLVGRVLTLLLPLPACVPFGLVAGAMSHVLGLDPAPCAWDLGWGKSAPMSCSEPCPGAGSCLCCCSWPWWGCSTLAPRASARRGAVHPLPLLRTEIEFRHELWQLQQRCPVLQQASQGNDVLGPHASRHHLLGSDRATTAASSAARGDDR